ncbi:tRNA (adenosine(37)-N6)-threonylcarbamoyltransferase complex ATPase subunit type 1 TsaE [uncultured Roseibium sp.]|uniref:tRNA (adenosine(37)-N6)-threonylcarbamoyltransferase complex ATPase subunit type 1 TsaE n=1 Tax=uncultured Roseibium sp. TaxID=1936171 RepID=UPI003217D937
MSGPALRDISDPFLVLDLKDEAATGRLAEDLAAILAPGDLIALTGDLGAGKSTFARALLRTLADDEDLEVPSPTFTLVQTYDFDRFAVSHFDLYRLEEPEELEELGLDELLETGAALVEWPEQGGDLLPYGALWLRFEAGEDDDSRRVLFASDNAGWPELLDRTLKIRHLLTQSGLGAGHRRHLTGDASTRSYERVSSEGRSAVVMNWPAPKGEAGSEAALAYNRLVHRAPGARAFVAVGEELRRRGFAAPAVFASDLEAGLLVLEDLGSGSVLSNGTPIAERYEQAVLVLAEMHGAHWPDTVRLPDGSDYNVPVYSREALQTEADLYLDWYVKYSTGKAATVTAREDFHRLWQSAFDAIAAAENGWVLRDYHSPNLIWREEQEGTSRVGLIDYQDTVIGPVAYDVASLLLDARVDIPEALEKDLYQAYVLARQTTDPDFDEAGFSAAYAVMGAQRITKILGIFIRLAERDGKPAYLDHLPRMQSYLDRVLVHPVLSDLKLWYDGNRG